MWHSAILIPEILLEIVGGNTLYHNNRYYTGTEIRCDMTESVSGNFKFQGLASNIMLNLTMEISLYGQFYFIDSENFLYEISGYYIEYNYVAASAQRYVTEYDSQDPVLFHYDGDFDEPYKLFEMTNGDLSENEATYSLSVDNKYAYLTFNFGTKTYNINRPLNNFYTDEYKDTYPTYNIQYSKTDFAENIQFNYDKLVEDLSLYAGYMSDEYYSNGYNTGYSTGYNNGKTDAYWPAYQEGMYEGYEDGIDQGYNTGKTEGITIGFNNGKQEVIDNPNNYNLFSPAQLQAAMDSANPVDIPGIMLQVLAMPWTFISNAFDLTLFPDTPYQINFANVFKGLIAILTLLFIIRLFTNGFNAIGIIGNNTADTNLKNSQTKLNKAKTKELESKKEE